MKKILNILHQSDDGYAKVCAFSIVSLLENNKNIDEINIYYLAYRVSEQNKNRLRNTVEPYRNCKLVFIDAGKYHDQLKGLGVTSWRGLYITWLKLLAINDLRLSTDRILYVNAHTIINSSLDDLLELDFDDKVLGLSYDCVVKEHKDTLGLRSNEGYYNCGVMLFNHKKWINDNIDAEVRTSLSKKSDYLIVDQDFCNVLFRDRILTLDSTYNFSSAYYGYDLKRLLRVNRLDNATMFYTYSNLMTNYYAPKIIHSLFGISGKPWEEGNRHPQKYLWKKYIDMTPWRSLPMPKAKYNINWFLYDLLPQKIFLYIYRFAVVGKYGKPKRNQIIVKLLDKFTPQKGT